MNNGYLVQCRIQTETQARYRETLGCDDRQAPRRLGWHHRELCADRTFPVRPDAGGLAGCSLAVSGNHQIGRRDSAAVNTEGPLRDRSIPPSRQDPQHLRSPLSHAWKQVDEFRASRKELGEWADWCFLPLAGTYAIVSKGKTLQSPNQTHHIGILGALAAWRVTQGIYRFDPTTFDALWKTPVTGDIPTEVLFHLPEWCVYIPTPDQTWQGSTLNGFFAHLEHDMNDRRTEFGSCWM